MTEFIVGQRVKVTDPKAPRFGEVGIVTELRTGLTVAGKYAAYIRFEPTTLGELLMFAKECEEAQ